MSLKKEGAIQEPRQEIERKPSKPATEKTEKQKSAAPKAKNLFQLELEKYAARKKGEDDNDWTHLCND